MPTGQHWAYFLYVNLAFFIYILAIFYFNQVAEIKANWANYRCNPLYMPLADDVNENFVYCIQSMQTNFMGYLLQPITFLTGTLSTTMGNFMEETNAIRAMFFKIRTFFSSIIQSVFGVFLNLVIEFQRITISMRDLVGKTIGIMVTLMYTLDGSIKTMNSTWKGPPGQMVRALGKCFHPNNLVKLQNGSEVKMKDLVLGDILSDGSIVEATMQILNVDNELFYEIITHSKSDHADSRETHIYVTGSHLVYDKDKTEFVKVSDYKNATKTNITSREFVCLITNTHTISFEGETFWDWEDHFIKYA
jgi:hypothetical protein